MFPHNLASFTVIFVFVVSHHLSDILLTSLDRFCIDLVIADWFKLVDHNQVVNRVLSLQMLSPPLIWLTIFKPVMSDIVLNINCEHNVETSMFFGWKMFFSHSELKAETSVVVWTGYEVLNIRLSLIFVPVLIQGRLKDMDICSLLNRNACHLSLL